MDFFEEIGIPRKYLKKIEDDKFFGLVHKSWLKSLVKHFKLCDFYEETHSATQPSIELDLGPSWTKIIITVLRKQEGEVIPLPRIRPLAKDDNPLLFPQLLEYISVTNFKNLWKEAYKKYSITSDINKESQVTPLNYNDVLREIIVRIYGCPLVNISDSSLNIETPQNFDVHLNILPVHCAVETSNVIFLLHPTYAEHNLSECVTFSPALLDKTYAKPLFIIYQLLNILKSLHDCSLTLGEISLRDIYMTEDMWIYVFPQIKSNIYLYETLQVINKKYGFEDCGKIGHKFNDNWRCEYCGVKTFDKVQISNENLEELCQLWINNQISNFTYISALNKFSGRKYGDPNCHYVFPWVSDFSFRCGKNWRDLRKSKYRLNKGDHQLDITYDNSQSQVPHHVSDVLSSITYYVYMARRTPKSILCKNVRTIWVPAEYPSSIQRMQEWTPDECIPEFYTDPSIFRSIHDDLDDLDVPLWASGPEDFVVNHREILESAHVSERLHHWIDLTFGYKLAGSAAVKAKNVCLHLVDEHEYITKSGLVQLFTCPHPAKFVNQSIWAKAPPKLYSQKQLRPRTRERSSSSTAVQDITRSDDDEQIADDLTSNITLASLGLSRILSRSRSSLNEDLHSRPSRSPSSQRLTNLGQKNPTFTSHVTAKSGKLSSSASTLSTGTIYLPKDYKPNQALDILEKKYKFLSSTFHFEQDLNTSTRPLRENRNIFYSNMLGKRILGEKNLTFQQNNEGPNSQLQNETLTLRKVSDQIICNYAKIISSRRMRELQVLGCVIMEIFLSNHLRSMGCYNANASFDKRLESCMLLLKCPEIEIHPCISYVVHLLLQGSLNDLKTFTYPAVSELGLPQPSAHLLLQPSLHCIVPFSKHFPILYKIIYSLKHFKNVVTDLNILYHFDCNGDMCSEYENLERRKILFAQNIGECKVKSCAKQLEFLLDEINPNTDNDMLKIILPHIKELLEEPPTSVLSAWYLFEPIARALGPQNATNYFLESLLKLYENEPSNANLPYMSKIAKLYHHSFLLRLMVRFGLKCFLENFVVPLVEAVGCYKDYDRVDFILHNHSEKVLKRASHLKNMNSDPADVSASDDSASSDKNYDEIPMDKVHKVIKEEEIFEFDDEKEHEEQMKSLLEHLELNIASDLPFNHSAAEEALEATLEENVRQLQNSEEAIYNSNEDLTSNNEGLVSPTISIPTSYHKVSNIICDVGSRKSENEMFMDNKFDTVVTESGESAQGLKSKQKKSDTKISDMSSDSLIWLSHRLGPVLSSKYLSRNLLKMLTLCYVGSENLKYILKENIDLNNISIISSEVIGDQNSVKVLECLCSIAGLYGEQLILSQYIPHISELVSLCKKKLSQNLEGGLISCFVLLKHIIPYLSDSMLMDQLQDVILKNIINPTLKILSSTKYVFPSGFMGRKILAHKYLDTLYVLSVRIGSDMTKKYLVETALQRFFLLFEELSSEVAADEKHNNEDYNCIGSPNNGANNIYPALSFTKDDLSSTPINKLEYEVKQLAINELKKVFNRELAHIAYFPFLKHLGIECLETTIKNHDYIQNMCQEFEKEMKHCNLIPKYQLSDFIINSNIPHSSSVGSNISLVGNRIDIQIEETENTNSNLLGLVSNRMESTTRHLRGNWLAYWEHEIGRAEKDTMFNFKQIKLQTFIGHSQSVKSLYVLDNENSFMSGSRDKTVKLWSMRSQGDGLNTCNCQWTYNAHKKSILSITFLESKRLVASCDSAVHIWDPFLGANLGILESPKFSPVNVLKSMSAPSTLIFAATTDGTIKVIDARLISYIYELKISVNPAGLIRSLAVSPSGFWIAAGQSSGNITVLDTRTGLVVANWRAHDGEVLQIIAVDDKTLISSSLDQNTSVWNVYEGKLRHHMRGATEPVHCLNLYNKELISGTTANRIGVHTSVDMDASFSSTKLRSDTFRGLLTSMAVLPLNRLLLLGADNGCITLLC